MPRHHQDWLKGYMQYTRFSESPTAFHFWTGVATLAGALRRKVWIEQNIFQWTPNFYIVLVGPPGVAAKSTSMRVGLSLLENIKGVKFGSQSSTWQALTEALKEAMEVVPYFNGTGVEEKIPMACVTIPVSELGTFLRVDDGKFVDVMVDMWDGQAVTWRHSTRTQGEVEIRNPWINMIACTTPSWLRENVPETMIGGGFTSRIIFVYGDKKRHLVAYPGLQHLPSNFSQERQLLLEDLAQIAGMTGPYSMSAAAVKWGTAWYERLWSERPSHMASERYSGYIARKQTHIHKLAIVLAASRRPAMEILQEDLQDADTLITDIEPDMIKVFESVGVVEEASRVHELVAFVKSYGFLTSDELWKLVMNTMSMKDFETALKAAVNGGVLVITEDKDHRRGVRAK